MRHEQYGRGAAVGRRRLETADSTECHPLAIRRPDRKSPFHQQLPRAALQIDEVDLAAGEVEQRAAAVRSEVQVCVVESFSLDGGRPPCAIDPHEPGAGFAARRNVDDRAVACGARHPADVLDHRHRVANACGISQVKRGGEQRRALLECEPAWRQIHEAVSANPKIADRSVVHVDEPGALGAIGANDGDERVRGGQAGATAMLGRDAGAGRDPRDRFCRTSRRGYTLDARGCPEQDGVVRSPAESYRRRPLAGPAKDRLWLPPRIETFDRPTSSAIPIHSPSGEKNQSVASRPSATRRAVRLSSARTHRLTVLPSRQL